MNRTSLLLGMLLLVAVFSCKNDLPPEDLTLPPPRANYAFYLDDYIDSLTSAARIPGLSITVVRDRKIDWNQGFGHANIAEGIDVDKDTRFMLAEAAEPVVAVAVMQMLAEKGYTLDDDINTLLPRPLAHANWPAAVITPRMLLSHTSGLRDNDILLQALYAPGDPGQRLRDFVLDYFYSDGKYYSVGHFSTERPGKTYRYARVNLALAGYLVEAATGIDFDLYCKTRLFSQLGYTSVSWFLNDLQAQKVAVPYLDVNGQYQAVEDYGYPMYPAGQLRITGEYLGRLMIALLQNGSYGDQRVASDEAVAASFRVQYPFIDDAQTLGWRLTDETGTARYTASGFDTGVSARLYIDTASGVAVILLCNASNKGAALDALAARLFDTAALF
ncbi:MAG: serine hydrolase domain-containing protein [Bacteroidia bacterium]